MATVERQDGRIVIRPAFGDLPVNEQVRRMQDAVAELQQREQARDPNWEPERPVPPRASQRS